MNLLADLSFTYYSINPDKGIEYGLEGVELATDIKWKEGEANSYSSLAVNQWSKSEYQKALEYYGKSIKINEELGNKRGIARDFGNIGIIYQNQSDYSKALEYYRKALKINKEVGNKNYAASNLANMGIIYQRQSDYPKALEYQGKALKINEELGNNIGIAGNLGNIGIIYENQSDYPKALEYHGKSLKINEELGNENYIAKSLGNIGNIYGNQSDYLKALEYFGKALKIKKELRDKNGVALYLGNIGNVYRDQSDYPKAIEYFEKALKIYKELGNKNGVARNLGSMGLLYLYLSQDSVKISPNELNDYVSLNKDINLNNAIKYSLKSIEIYKEIGELKFRSDNLNKLAFAYKLKGNYKKAYEAHVEHKLLQDSVFNEEKSKEIGKMEAQREQLEADYAEEEAIRKEQEEIDRRNQVQYSIISVVTVLIFGVIFYFIRRNVSFGAIDTLTFIAFLLLYEFVLVLTEPWVDEWTHNVPIYKLLINIGFALILIPLQKLEHKIKGKFDKK
ncbi:tetratricopeptide repeat protein [Candidatus Kapabacteria bacterium]|nr:tetratricopeptide repeat protein [Candidatus Kapabacteria bacterium]